jgi:ribose transport system permease protein
MPPEVTAPSVLPTLSSVRLRRNGPLLVVYGLLLALVVAVSLSGAREQFWRYSNIFNLLRQTAFLGTLALGQMLAILTGGIDLSVGSLVKLSVLVSAIGMSTRTGSSWTASPENMWLAILGTLALGLLVGMIHAVVITRLKIAPFIVTLGTYSILRGIAYAISTGPVGRAAPDVLRFYDLRLGDIFGLSRQQMNSSPTLGLFLVPIIVLFFVFLLIATIFILRRTPFGRHIYAVGGNEQVARLSGISVDRVKFGVYILCSLLAALTGLMYLSRYGVGDPNTGEGLELQSITAVILGGTSLFGGRGGVVGTLGGVLLLGLTANLLVILNVTQWYQELIQGVIIVAAVALYKQKGRQ